MLAAFLIGVERQISHLQACASSEFSVKFVATSRLEAITRGCQHCGQFRGDNQIKV